MERAAEGGERNGKRRRKLPKDVTSKSEIAIEARSQKK